MWLGKDNYSIRFRGGSYNIVKDNPPHPTLSRFMSEAQLQTYFYKKAVEEKKEIIAKKEVVQEPKKSTQKRTKRGQK